MERFKSEKEILPMVLFISMVLFGLGLLFPCFSAWYNKPIFDHVAVLCWILSALPFMVLQLFIPFRIEKYLETTWTIILLVVFCIFGLLIDFWFLFWLIACSDYYLYVYFSGSDYFVSVSNPHQLLTVASFGSLGLLCLLFDLGTFLCLIIRKVKMSQNKKILEE